MFANTGNEFAFLNKISNEVFEHNVKDSAYIGAITVETLILLSTQQSELTILIAKCHPVKILKNNGRSDIENKIHSHTNTPQN